MQGEYTGKDFQASLKQGTLKPALIVRGIVKPSDKKEFILFSGDGRCENWIEVPVDSIEKATVLGEMQCKDHKHQAVALQLREPAGDNPEGIMYAAMFRSVFHALTRLERRVIADLSAREDTSSVPQTSNGPMLRPKGQSWWECYFDTCTGWGCGWYCTFGAP